ncbi:MAG TPA: 1-deoxy-D-xylulose-5-phosphate synthase, partial [bacterium]|nr:1-deoxy-D-xylulose-5-phosphate synthase [bacterium]
IKTRMTVILNDNEMSIAPNVGAISQYPNKLIANPKYNKYKEQLEEALYNLPRIGKITKIISKKIQESIKNLVVPKIIFEEFGFRYFGPIDGHNLNDMINLFDKILYYSGPKLIHIRTTKGKGYKYAEENPSYYHGLGPFDIDTGKLKSNAKISFTDVFGQTIINLAERNPKIFAITAAMPDGTGLTEFSQKFPDRFFDVGITEDFAVTFAAGLAAGGKKPIIAIYSTFLQRSIDQIYHDVALQRDIYPIFAIDRAGIVGADGPTHHGTLDLTYLLMIPNIVIMAPADEYDMVAMFKLAATLDMPCAIRYPRANIEGNKIPTLDEAQDLEFGAPQILNTGDKALILCVGPVARRAAKIISEKNISATVVNIRFVKPLNEQFLKTEIPKYDKIITIEENTIIGGFGAYINNFINANKFFGKQILNIGIPDRFIDAGEINEVYTTFEFDNDALFRRITDFLK